MSDNSMGSIIFQYFPYLSKKYEFEIIEEKKFHNFGNWLVVLKSNSGCRIRILYDRGEIQLSFGPNWFPSSWESGPWFSSNFILFYLDESSENLSNSYKDLEDQLAKISDLLERKINKICRLFESENFKKNRIELEIMQKKYEQNIWDSLIQ